jgi:hypothetical protein
MGYSWFRVDSAFVRHPKTLALKAELNNPIADAYITRLWAWTQVYAPSGRIPAALIAGLEAELLWTGSAGSLAAALEKTGWLDRVGSDFEVHDWADLQGFHVKKAKKDADKKRKRRARASARTDSGQNGDGAALSPRTAPPTDVTDGRNVTDGTNETDNPQTLMPGPSDLAQLWNAETTAPLPRVTLPLEGERKRLAAEALKRRSLPMWRQVFQRVQASAFCRGTSDSGWLATFDWATRPAGKKPEPATSILEGAYDRAPAGPPTKNANDVAPERYTEGRVQW